MTSRRPHSPMLAESPYHALGMGDLMQDCRKRQLLEHYMHAYNPALAFELGILPADAPWMVALPKEKREEVMRAKLARAAYGS